MAREFSLDESKNELFLSELNKYHQRLLFKYDNLAQMDYFESQKKLGLDDIPEADREVRMEQLRRKQKEYGDRLATKFGDKNISSIGNIDTITKYNNDLLYFIFTRRSVETKNLEKAYLIEKNAFNQENFAIACGVIEDYLKTGGKSLIGGTGLK